MMWLYHKNWLHSPLSLCLHLHKCLMGVSFTPVPPPARDQKMVARKTRYDVWRNALAFFYIPKTASLLDFFDRDHTYYIAFLHLCIRLHDLNVKPKICWWLKGSKWISCVVQGHPCVDSKRDEEFKKWKRYHTWRENKFTLQPRRDGGQLAAAFWDSIRSEWEKQPWNLHTNS